MNIYNNIYNILSFDLIVITFSFQSTIPHSYAVIDINIDKLIELRSKLKAENINLSLNDFIIKAVAHALLECPDVNTLYQKEQVSMINWFNLINIKICYSII